MIRRVDEKFGAGSENVSNLRSFQITNWFWVNVDVSCLEGRKPSIVWYSCLEAWNCRICSLDQPHSDNLLRTFWFFFSFGIPMEPSLSPYERRRLPRDLKRPSPKKYIWMWIGFVSLEKLPQSYKLILGKIRCFLPTDLNQPEPKVFNFHI